MNLILYFNWSPSTPGLSATKFCLWGYLIVKVYYACPAITPELKQRIQYIEVIPYDLLQHVMASAPYLMQECRGGNHLANYWTALCGKINLAAMLYEQIMLLRPAHKPPLHHLRMYLKRHLHSAPTWQLRAPLLLP
jgi:hypothetical protein